MSDSVREAFEKFVADFSECDSELIKAKREGTSYSSLELAKSYIVWQTATAAADAEWRGVVEKLIDGLEKYRGQINQHGEHTSAEDLAQAEKLMGMK